MVGITPGNYIKTFKYFEDYKDNAPKNDKYLGFLRFIQYDGPLDEIGKRFVNPPIESPETCSTLRRKLRMQAISVANERKMLQKLKEIAGICLAKFPQSYDEDVKLLASSKLTYNERNCIYYRCGEKKVFPLF